MTFQPTLCFLSLQLVMMTLFSCTVKQEKNDGTAHAVAQDVDGDGTTTEQGDYDDTDAQIAPTHEDQTIDGIDQNCDGLDGPDRDGDGWIDVTAGGQDCDDTDPESHLQIPTPTVMVLKPGETVMIPIPIQQRSMKMQTATALSIGHVLRFLLTEKMISSPVSFLPS